MKNSGYVIYPQNTEVMRLSTALDMARDLSAEGEDTRVEYCDTGEVVARFRDGYRLE